MADYRAAIAAKNMLQCQNKYCNQRNTTWNFQVSFQYLFHMYITCTNRTERNLLLQVITAIEANQPPTCDIFKEDEEQSYHTNDSESDRTMPGLVPSSRSSSTESRSSDYMSAKSSAPSLTDSEQSLFEIAEEIDEIEMNESKSTTFNIDIVADDSEAGKDDKSMTTNNDNIFTMYNNLVGQ